MVSILLTGIAALDIIHSLDTYPGADDEVRADARRISCGGNAANSANVLAQLGHSVSLACNWADDLIATEIRALLSQRNINLPIHTSMPGQSPLSCITLSSQTHSRNIIHYRDLPELDFKTWQQLPLDNYLWFHFEGRNPDHTVRMMQAARDLNCHISLELEKPRDGLDQLLPLADVIMLSRPYAEAHGFASARECLEYFSRNHQGILSCTWGQQGAWLYSRGQMYHAQAQTTARIVDTLGAGDTYNAGLIHAIATGMRADQAVDFAARLATTKTTQTGLDQLV